MISNDYIKGYFDAHGYIYSIERQTGALRWRIVFQDQDRSQVQRVQTFLTKNGYHPRSYLRRDKSLCGPRTVQKITITKQPEVERFIKEIGTERSEYRERFNQFLVNKSQRETCGRAP